MNIVLPGFTCRTTVPVSSFAEASVKFRAAVARCNFGARDLHREDGRIYDDSGAPIAKVSFNGRVWDVHDNEITI